MNEEVAHIHNAIHRHIAVHRRRRHRRPILCCRAFLLMTCDAHGAYAVCVCVGNDRLRLSAIVCRFSLTTLA